MQDNKAPPFGGTEETGDVTSGTTSLQPQEFQSRQDDVSHPPGHTHVSQAPLNPTHQEPEAYQTIHENPHSQYQTVSQTADTHHPHQQSQPPRAEELPLLEPTVYCEQTARIAPDHRQVSQIDATDDILQPTLADKPHQIGQSEMETETGASHTAEPSRTNVAYLASQIETGTQDTSQPPRVDTPPSQRWRSNLPPAVDEGIYQAHQIPLDPRADGEPQPNQDDPANSTHHAQASDIRNQAHQSADSDLVHIHESGGDESMPGVESLSTNYGVNGPLAVDQIVQPDEDSNSPWSAESSRSNQTDSAYQFYQAHYGYQDTEMDTGPEAPQGLPSDRNTEKVGLVGEHQQLSSEAQPEGSNTHSADDVVLPDDGYYPTSLHVDSEMSDTDSAIGTDIQSSTMSLRSSLYESIQENGRSYHKYKEGQYFLPNDDVEQDRLNLQHHLWTLTLDGRLHLAPVEDPQRVLDIGTGTGLWALEYAERNPSAMVIGTDLSAIQPEYVPPNCQFEIDDAEDEWTYNQTFDFIHGRMLFSCFQNPAEVFKRAFQATSPGGYFEMQDVLFKISSIDGSGDGSAVERWNHKICLAAKKIGRDWHCAGNYAQWMRDAGFEGVVERQLKWPSNTWPKGKKQKLLGMWSMANSLDGLSAISMALMTRAYGMTREEVEVEMVEVRKDIKDKSLHGFVPVYVVYGRKPAL
ncbi:uncharacterized protein BP5553_07455 [Venustampulla echinocandica]|uniref:S-adenosyl-L-methionine-dependent methyltransferase n=1 Tax=Venustampulla echinocandica TaxID=2656787 RepID=A0A370TGJ3_9HELO|nr:uncharacterized protein BP5553_07455 [Venustampulla echinocandica]RDL34327.1 hypothetical protein BP5553_07455 [Venustampulla echinocandica]